MVRRKSDNLYYIIIKMIITIFYSDYDDKPEVISICDTPEEAKYEAIKYCIRHGVIYPKDIDRDNISYPSNYNFLCSIEDEKWNDIVNNYCYGIVKIVFTEYNDEGIKNDIDIDEKIEEKSDN